MQSPHHRLVEAAIVAVCCLQLGCNLFRAEDLPNAADLGTTDASVEITDVTPDQPRGADASLDDSGFPDTGDCVPEPEQQACADRDVVCGPLMWEDNCGLQRAAICDACDPDSAVCDGVAMTCSCLDGFEPDSVTDCVDVDECAEALDDCPNDKFCVNVAGGFECNDCPAGQLKDANGVCEDADECALGTDNCDPLVSCTNLDPFFECGDCPAGYDDTNGDGTACNDIDECADGADDCDANATCSNLPGSFDCACNAPYMGDGRTCVLPPAGLVAGVHHVSISVIGSSGDVPLPAAITDASKVVPFAAVRLDGMGSELDATLVDVWIDVGRNEVVAEREDPSGSMVVAVTLVEFAEATVQAGTFDLDANDSTVVPLGAGFDVAKSFVVFTSRVNGASGSDRNPVMAELDYDGTSLTFTRRISFGERLQGHWYAVEAATTEFASQVHRMNLGFDDVCATVNTSVDFQRTMLIASAGSPSIQANSLDNPSKAYVSCRPMGAAVECCRGQPDPFDNGISVTLFTVEFEAGSNGAVEHHPVSVASGMTTDTVNLTNNVDVNWAMPFLGSTGLPGAMTATADLPSATQNSAFGTAVFDASGGSITVEIGEPTTAAIGGSVQAVTWPH